MRVLSRERMLPGLPGLGQTEFRIAQAIRRCAKDPEVQWRAREITSGVPPHEPLRQIQAVFRYLIGPQGFPYRNDPVDVELLQPPPALPKGGDCDDYVVQGGAYLEALGHPVEVVVMGTRRPRPGQTARYHHVALRVLDTSTGIWWPFDPVLHRPTRGEFAQVGDELPHAVERTFRMFMTPSDPNQMVGGNPIQDFFFWIDPSRKESPLRQVGESALNLLLPGAGTAAGVALDAGAALKRALVTSAPTPAPATATAALTTVEPAAALTTSSSATATPMLTEPKKGLSTGAKVAVGALAVGVVGGGIWALTRRKKTRRKNPSRRRRRRTVH